jgi:hypothetical protein
VAFVNQDTAHLAARASLLTAAQGSEWRRVIRVREAPAWISFWSLGASWRSREKSFIAALHVVRVLIRGHLPSICLCYCIQSSEAKSLEPYVKVYCISFNVTLQMTSIYCLHCDRTKTSLCHQTPPGLILKVDFSFGFILSRPSTCVGNFMPKHTGCAEYEISCQAGMPSHGSFLEWGL